MSHHKIELSRVSYTYPDGNKAIDDVSFLIGHGESIGVVGANGAGKSTLLSILTGIVFPQEGDVRIGDIPVTKKTLGEVRRSIGMTFQDPDDQLFMTTVYEDVAFGPRNLMLDEIEVKKRVDEALIEVGMQNIASRPAYRLSGGEKRLVSIATTTAMKPDILIMDEPSASLDPKARRRLMQILKGFSHTKIITSHDLDMILEICDRTIVLKNGKIAADGRTYEILTNGKLMEDCGLEMPLSVSNCPICSSKKLPLK